MAHPLLEKAAQHTAQARAINDEFEGKPMPAEAAHQMKQHLDAASEYKRRVELEAQLNDTESWISEPQHKHDMAAGPGGTGGRASGDFKSSAELYETTQAERKRKSFLDYCRKGLDALTVEQKADLVENATGLNLVPQDYAGTILKQLPREGVIRNLAYVRPTTKPSVDIGNVTIGTAGWGKLETQSPVTTLGDGMGTAGKDTVTVHDLNALVKLGRDELDDTDENLEEVIRQALLLKFAELEDDAFANGTGTGQPWGIAQRAVGAVGAGVITQGVAAAANATVTADDLKTLPFKVPAQFRRSRSCYLMPTAGEQAVALLKGSGSEYLLQKSTALGEPDTLFGYRVYTVDGLPSMTAGGIGVDPSIIFGDVFAGYMIADRRQVTVQRLNEMYAPEGKVGLLFTHRVGGDVIRPTAFAKYLL